MPQRISGPFSMEEMESSLHHTTMESRDDMLAQNQRGDRYSSESEKEDEASSDVMLNHTLVESESGTGHHRANGLNWRMDPTTSFSDFTLEVLAVENGVKKSRTLYHVHSNVIVWGRRRGGFFVQLFQDRMRQKPPSSTSRVQVTPAEAEAFPIMLDFMYCENSLPLSPDLALTLYSMADKFVVPLQKPIEKFLGYLSLKQTIEFVQYAQEQQEENHKKEIEKLVLCAVSKLCGYLVKHPLEAKLVQPSLLLHTLEQRAKFVKKLKEEDPRTYSGEWEAERSRLLSCVVAECCKEATKKEHKLPNGEYETLSGEQFKQLMSYLPAYESEAAVALMQVDKKLKKESTNNKLETALRNNMNSSSVTPAFEDQLVNVLGGRWRGMLSEKGNNDDLVEFLQELSPRVLAKLLVNVSQQYEQKLVAAEESAAGALSPKHDILSQPSRKSAKSMTSTMVNIHQAE